MAKKHRHRTWYTALFQPQANDVFYNKKLPAGTVFFDNPSLAYGQKASERFKPLRDKNGDVIVNHEGYAQLPKTEKITVIGIKGKAIDWKRIEKAPKGMLAQLGMKGDAIKVNYDILLWRQTMDTVLEETDEQYNKLRFSPLGAAGGLADGDLTNETISSETKSDAGGESCECTHSLSESSARSASSDV